MSTHSRITTNAAELLAGMRRASQTLKRFAIASLFIAATAAAVPADQVIESEHGAALVEVTATPANPQITVRIIADGKVVFDRQCRGGFVHGHGDPESPDYVQFQTGQRQHRRFFAKHLTLRINGAEPPPRQPGQPF